MAAPSASPAGYEVVIAPDPKIHDGRFGGNAWLQELPAPMTKLTWGNAAVLSPATAEKLGVRIGDHVEISAGGGKLRAPCFVLPGVADASIGLTLGYGRTVGPTVARGHGVDVAPLRTAAAPWGTAPVEIRRVAGRTDLAYTQEHWTQEGRPIALLATVEEAAKGDVTEDQRGRLPSLLADNYTAQQARQWGMVIDLSTCTGCSACVVACQAENNIPVVGPTGVRRSREMHWLRIDRYFTGPANDPAVVNQPMLCQHCEKAPCEYVCPTNATVHSDDGLNEMVYNRCIGTRFCSNNCPYKVRRFNFLLYQDFDTPQFKMMRNPDVTVRSRGVMEKCTYCVQRINAAKIDAHKRGTEEIVDGAIVTACQQTCPSAAIVFGDLNDPKSEVSRWKAGKRSYVMLEELNVRPRTTYLGRVENPNPEIA